MKKSKVLMFLLITLILTMVLLITSCDKNEVPIMSEPQEETTHQHIFGEWTTVKEPSCSEKGSKERSCECGEKETEILDPKHFYTEIVTVPTKTTDGYTTHTCSVCNDSYTDTVVPAIGSTGLAYEINEASRTCTVTGTGTCTDSEVAIPQIIDGYTVTAIGEKAFANCTTITSIKIPESVKSIGYRAFYGCSGITEITIPKSVTDIGTQIFYKCENLNKVYYNSSYSNRDNAFLNLSHINTIVFGGNTVPKEILYEHKFITEIVILDPVKSIENDAFWHCSNLTSVTILSNSITRIGGFTGCSSLTSFTIPDSVTTINSMAFCSCSSLTSITIPDSVTSIRNYAFKNCSSLTSITIPESVTSISEEMFMQCSSLKSIILHDAVTSIHYRAFWGCSSLTSIIIPNSVTYIGEGAFYETKNLESAYYEGTVSEWKNISFVHGLESTTGLSRICRYYSKTQPADTTYKYWHYVNGVPTEW